MHVIACQCHCSIHTTLKMVDTVIKTADLFSAQNVFQVDYISECL